MEAFVCDSKHTIVLPRSRSAKEAHRLICNVDNPSFSRKANLADRVGNTGQVVSGAETDKACALTCCAGEPGCHDRSSSQLDAFRFVPYTWKTGAEVFHVNSETGMSAAKTFHTCNKKAPNLHEFQAQYEGECSSGGTMKFPCAKEVMILKEVA